MWPWEHFAIGYVVVSLVFYWRDRPLGSSAVGAVLLGTQFPDLVDKPLAWAFNVLPSGTSLAHSLLVAVPLSVFAGAVGVWYWQTDLGIAFGIGYLLHLPGDILYGTVTSGGTPSVSVVLWPFVSTAPPEAAPGLLTQALYFLGQYQAFLNTPQAVGYLLFEATLLGVAVLLWRRDGYPGTDLVGVHRQRT